jgi:hypothetical protein
MALWTRGSGPGSHWQSAGMIRDATPPGDPSAASTADRLASDISCADLTVRVQPTVPASAAISDVRGTSKTRCRVACSPIQLTTGVCARRALCRFAMPLANPGPRCSSVAAGRPVMRPHPSAAPVQTPSNSPSTTRIPGARSRAATIGISVVPGFAKQISTPACWAVRSRLNAPVFIRSSPMACFGQVRRRSRISCPGLML